VVWASKPLGGRFLKFGSQEPVGVPIGMGGDTWRHHKVCVEAKQSREEHVDMRCLDLKLDHFAPVLNGSAKISEGVLGMCNNSINKVPPTSYLFNCFHF
jgi:hypothetical protein